MKWNINGHVTKDQTEIAGVLGNYFANIAEGIRNEQYADKVEQEFLDHPSVSAIANNANRSFKFEALQLLR